MFKSKSGFVRANVAPIEDSPQGPWAYVVERFKSFPMGWKRIAEGTRPTEQEALEAARFAVSRFQ